MVTFNVRSTSLTWMSSFYFLERDVIYKSQLETFISLSCLKSNSGQNGRLNNPKFPKLWSQLFSILLSH